MWFHLPQAAAFKNVRKHCSNTITRLIKGVTDRSICLLGWTSSLPHAQSVTLLTYSHTPPLRLPSSSWLGGVISSSQLLLWCTTDWTSSCCGPQQHWLLYHLQLRASGDWDEDTTNGFSSIGGFLALTCLATMDKYWIWLIFPTVKHQLQHRNRE